MPFVFSSNGDAFLFRDQHRARAKRWSRRSPSTSFPSPDELWKRYRAWKGLDGERERVVTQEYFTDAGGKAPRYYQGVAINRAVEAIAGGQDRILLVMATGTGKTYTAFQIIWRLWKAGVKKRILFLADRNILVDQTKTNDFKPFGQAMTKIANRTIDKSYEIYLSLYQAVTGTEEERNIYKEFSRDFFDLVVIDECHRGSAAEDSAWREILEYFSGATHLGLTATPKETKDVSNIHYFGEPIYTYSLRQGIDDGFLAPYKVVRIDLDKDLTGWRPEAGQVDKFGEEIEDRIYNQRDFDRSLVLEERTKLVARKLSEFLKGTDRFAKTIVFCENVDHAERMRQALVNENADLAAEDARYVMRITGDDLEGKLQLDNFIDPESRYPVIATTSELLTTGVDAQTCKADRAGPAHPVDDPSSSRSSAGARASTRTSRSTTSPSSTSRRPRSCSPIRTSTVAPVMVYEPGEGESVVPPEPGPGGEEPTGVGPDHRCRRRDRRRRLARGRGRPGRPHPVRGGGRPRVRWSPSACSTTARTAS